MEGQKYILIMTLLVKDEEDIIEENLKFHHMMGVDGFIVTDNNSTDKTPDILKKYKDKGWILEIINEKASGYEQKKWVHRMIKIAKNKYKAKWIINANADEFWHTPSGSLKNETSLWRNIIRVPIKNVFPSEGKLWQEYDSTVRIIPESMAKEYGLSKFHIFRKLKYKVMHKTFGYIQIHMGNHKVSMFPPIFKKSNITLYHYCYRGEKLFERKVINGGKELLTHSSKHGGNHWRYYYNVWLKGELDGEYNNIVGINQLKKLKEGGYIIKDNPMPDIFKKLKSPI